MGQHSALTAPNQVPILLFAFADDRTNTARKLRNLAEEVRLLRAIFEPLDQRGICQAEFRTDVTLKELFDFFRHPAYHRRVILFHFAGHADSYELLLQDERGLPAAAYPHGLAKFLALQEGLHLVFLNGCSTEAQMQGLLAEGVPAVIATHQAIDDRLAALFAAHVYSSLAVGDRLQKAFDQAQAASAAELENAAQAYRGYRVVSPSDVQPQWPWLLRSSARNRAALEWRLPEMYDAAPPVPENAPGLTLGDVATLLPMTTRQPTQIFVRYERSEPDKTLAPHLIAFLRQAGHTVFSNQDSVLVGLNRITEQQRLMAQSRYMLVLLSPAALRSETLVEEVAFALKAQLQILPLYLALNQELPPVLAQLIGGLQPAEWRGSADTVPVLYVLYQAIEARAAHLSPAANPPESAELRTPQPLPAVGITTRASELTPERPAQGSQLSPPQPYADARLLENLPQPGGAIEGDSALYVVRKADQQLTEGLLQTRESCFSIRAPRQTGKSSILYRALIEAQQAGHQVVDMDFQPVDRTLFQDARTFLRYFCQLLLRKLRLEPGLLDATWDDSYLPQDNVNTLWEEQILPQTQNTIVLAIDEADSLLESNFYGDFFSLIRYWRQRRAFKAVWRKLKVILIISTEPYLLIDDPYRSPFNVGQHIQISDFDLPQIAYLHSQYGAPFQESDLPQLLQFCGGHPYLTQLALYTAVQEQLKWADLAELSSKDDGPFVDHLHHHLWSLQARSELLQHLREVVFTGRCTAADAFHRLKRFGLIQGEPTQCRCRCELYQTYFSHKL